MFALGLQGLLVFFQPFTQIFRNIRILKQLICHSNRLMDVSRLRPTAKSAEKMAVIMALVPLPQNFH
jgi:hypothetical protein